MAEENDNELVKAEIVEAEPDDTVVSLPTYDDYGSDEKVLNHIRHVVKGFDFDLKTDYSKRFNSVEEIAAYIGTTFESIREDASSAVLQMANQGAINAVRVYSIGYVIKSALESNRAYGANARAQIQKALEQYNLFIGDSDMYHYTSIATKLTLTDCFLLGARGCKKTHLRSLAYIKSDAMRRSIIESWIRNTKVTGNRYEIERSYKALNMAIKQAGDAEAAPEIDGTTVQQVQEVTDVYTTVIDDLKKVASAAKRLADYTKFAKPIVDDLNLIQSPDDYNNSPEHEKMLIGKLAEVNELLALVDENSQDLIANMEGLRMRIQTGK